MDYTTLGNTGLRVSVAGLGCGGFSRLGLGNGGTEADAIAVVREALAQGVNFFDTAEAYGTEEVVGKALRDQPRDAVVISTKAQMKQGGAIKAPEAVVRALEASLQRLGVDYVDVFHLHGVPPDLYEATVNELVPALLAERDKGKFRHLGVTESPPTDPALAMLSRAVQDGHFAVVMVAFHMLHQMARQRVFPHTQSKGIGTLLMFAVRVLFSQPGRLRQVVGELVAEGTLPPDLATEENPLGFLLHEGGASSIIDAAYRFCRHEPGVDVVLFGTGNPAHVRSNVASIVAPPLPAADTERLRTLFGHLEGIGLDRPGAGR